VSVADRHGDSGTEGRARPDGDRSSTPSAAARSASEQEDRTDPVDCVLTVRLPVVGAAATLCPTGPR
jgi:hypothetical protein